MVGAVVVVILVAGAAGVVPGSEPGPVSVVVRSGCDLGPVGEQVEERADPVSFLGGVPEQAVPVHGVHHAPPGAGPGEVPGGLQVGHDGLHGALGQADGRADVPDAGFGVAGDFHQDVPVAGQQRPGTAAAWVRVAHVL